jgi:outer membrane protein assembly factor BamB
VGSNLIAQRFFIIILRKYVLCFLIIINMRITLGSEKERVMKKLKKSAMVLAFLFIVNAITAQEVLSQDVTVYDQNGHRTGFVDDFGLYHQFMPEGTDISDTSKRLSNSSVLLQKADSNLVNAPLTQDEFAWPMLQCNKNHDGYLPILLEPGEFTLRWQKPLGDISTISAADGFLFFKSGKTVYALDAIDGDTLWSITVGSAYSVNPPSYGYGKVYFQSCNHSSDTWLHAVNAETGQYVFKSGFSAQWESYYAPTIYDGKVYINGGYYGGMYAYDAFTGQRLWFRELNQYDEWTPAVDEQYAYAYIGESCSGCNNAGLNIVNRQTGAIVTRIGDSGFDWHGWSMELAPVIGSAQNVIVIQNSRLICFDAVNKKIAWQVSGAFTGQPVVAKGEIYSINGGGILDVRNEATGTLLWTWQPPEGALTGTIIVTDSHVIAATASNTYAVDLLSRTMTWSYPAAGTLALANQTLYIGGSGSLTAIAAEEQSPSNPVAIDIEGPQQVSENNQAEYKSTVHYDDGRARNRTLRTKWSVEPNEWAKIDDRAILQTEELISPEQYVTISAAYTENNITLIGKNKVKIVVDCNLTELIHRNLTKAIDGKKQILTILDSALRTETATVKTLFAVRRGSISDKCSMSVRDNMYSQMMQAIFVEKCAERWINMSIEDLNDVNSLLFNKDQKHCPHDHW